MYFPALVSHKTATASNRHSVRYTKQQDNTTSAETKMGNTAMYSVKSMKRLLLAGMIGLTGLLAGCGGGGAGGGTTTGTTGGTTTASPSMVVTLTDATTGTTLTTLTAGVTGKLTATVKDESGTAVASALVTFSTASTYGTFNPASGTTLTNASGVATMLISGGGTSGASSATVTAVWKENSADVSVSGSVNYIVSAAGAVALTISSPVFGVTPLSAYGTTSVSVTIGGTTTPLNVAFSSPCATSGKAVLTTSVTTINNVATASYRDNGCGNTDTITASVTTGDSASSNLTVSPPSAGSIQFVSASPSIISLKGTGSATLPEFSTVKFKILDTAGNPISKQVNFALSTGLGGITFNNGLATATATSDATTGEVQIGVNSGALPTPLRVLATINGTAIQTQSNQLSITTGLPDQAHTSLSYSTFNIDGWRFDGTTTMLTVRMADHLSNPVPDGTVVNFVAEGGRVDALCTTINSECQVTFTSQNLRPIDGRVTVLAYAVGEESFTDLNSNGTVDSSVEMIDANNLSTDIGEAFVDYNENGSRDAASEPYFDFDGDGSYRAGGDGKYNGILCTSGASICSTNKTLHVYRSVVVVLSDSQPVSADIFSKAPSAPIDLGGCGVSGANAGRTISFDLVLHDLNNNPLPAATVITVTSTNGTIELGGSQTVPNSTSRFVVGTTLSAFNYPILIKNDASPADATCADTTVNGVMTVTIDPPVGASTSYSISVVN